MTEIVVSKRNGLSAPRVMFLITACRVLGIAKTKQDIPTDNEVLLHDAKRAYHKLLKEHHVDKGGQPEAHRIIVAAYKRVKDFCNPKSLTPPPTNKLYGVSSKARAVQRYWDNLSDEARAKRGRAIKAGHNRSKPTL